MQHLLIYYYKSKQIVGSGDSWYWSVRDRVKVVERRVAGIGEDYQKYASNGMAWPASIYGYFREG